jgi:archaemetzincin
VSASLVYQGVDLIRAAPEGGSAPTLELLDWLSMVIARRLGVSCRAHEAPFDIQFAYDAARDQYYSSAILAQLAPRGEHRAILAVTTTDLYVPVLTFVFGEAQLGGPRAIVSLRRLKDEFYGMAPSPEKLSERLAKEALHELGHTLGLRHCDNWRCVMSSSHAVERLDVKESQYCGRCAAAIGR